MRKFLNFKSNASFSTYKWEMFVQNTVFAELTYTDVAFAKVRCLATDPVWVQLVIFFSGSDGIQ